MPQLVFSPRSWKFLHISYKLLEYKIKEEGCFPFIFPQTRTDCKFVYLIFHRHIIHDHVITTYYLVFHRKKWIDLIWIHIQSTNKHEMAFRPGMPKFTPCLFNFFCGK